jgi:small subunit ribosomal protein S8
MTMQDPIADLLTRVRNAQAASHEAVAMPCSKIKLAICAVLKEEGYIDEFSVDDGPKKTLNVALRYHEGQPVIEEIKRVSRPGLRVYKGCDDLPEIRGGLGVAIISTPQGVMTNRAARAQGVGGEVLCTVF